MEKSVGLGEKLPGARGSAGLRVLAGRGPHGQGIKQRRRNGRAISAGWHQSRERVTRLPARNTNHLRLSGCYGGKLQRAVQLQIPDDAPRRSDSPRTMSGAAVEPVTDYSAPKMRLKNRPILRKNPGFFGEPDAAGVGGPVAPDEGEGSGIAAVCGACSLLL